MDERTIDRIYASMLDEVALHEALVDLARSCGARSAGLFRVRGGELDWERSVEMPDEFMPAYAADYAPRDPRFAFLMAKPVGTVLTDALPEVRRTMAPTDVDRFLNGYDLPFTTGVLLHRDAGQFWNLYVSRSHRQGAPQAETFETFGSYVSHFTRALRLKLRAGLLDAQLQNGAQGLGEVRGRILLDGHRRVRYLDAGADRIMNCMGQPRILNLQLRWAGRRASEWFDQALVCALTARCPGWTVAPLAFASRKPSGVLTVSLTAAGYCESLAAVVAELPASMLLLSLHWRADEALRLSSKGIHLTPRQSQVLHLLASGHSSTKVAQVLGCTPNTARNHGQALLERLGCGNRIEMLQRARELELV